MCLIYQNQILPFNCNINLQIKNLQNQRLWNQFLQRDAEFNDDEQLEALNEDTTSEGNQVSQRDHPNDSPVGAATRSGQVSGLSKKRQFELGLTDQAHLAHYDALHEDDYKLQDEMMDPFAFLSQMDDEAKDTLYYHDAMKHHYAKQFKEAMLKKFKDHCKRKDWDLVQIDDVPDKHQFLDSVWAFKRKGHIKTRQIYKWKARLNIHGGQQSIGENFYEMHAPVVKLVHS